VNELYRITLITFYRRQNVITSTHRPVLLHPVRSYTTAAYLKSQFDAFKNSRPNFRSVVSFCNACWPQCSFATGSTEILVITGKYHWKGLACVPFKTWGHVCWFNVSLPITNACSLSVNCKQTHTHTHISTRNNAGDGIPCPALH